MDKRGPHDRKFDPPNRLNSGLVRESAAKNPRRLRTTVPKRGLCSLCTQETETARRTPKFLVRGGVAQGGACRVAL